MNYKVLYRKYRPSDFDNLIGQDYTKRMLTNIIKSGKVGHAYIFTGPRGTGKTSSAKLFAKAINCLDLIDGSPCGKCVSCEQFADSPDIIEIDAASNNGVEEMRELIDNVKLSPSSLKYKVYIVDEVHMLSQSAFNALLLTLEEPPSHVVFILATTDIQSVPITILSRCQRFDFRPIDNEAIISRLRYVSEQENIEITDEALREVAFIAAGGMRDALSILDQLAADNVKIDSDVVISNFGTISTERIREFVADFVADMPEKVLDFLGDVKSKGVYYSVFLEKLIIELRNEAIAVKLGESDADFDRIYDLIYDLNSCLSNLNVNVNPFILIEMAVLKHIKVGERDVGVVSSIKSDSEEKIENAEEVVAMNTDKYEEKREENISREIKSEEISSQNVEIDADSKGLPKGKVIDNFVRIRVNNCFAEANKESKGRVLENWKGLVDKLAVTDMYMMSLLADCSVEAASDRYVIISSRVDSTNSLINNVISEIETLYTSMYNIECKFVALTSSEWDNAREEFIKNTRNNIPYTLIDEELGDAILAESDELEKLALEIFGSDNIEFE